MTANEMEYNFFVLFDKYFEYGAPGYDDKQVSTLLTKAQLRIVKRKFDASNNRTGKGFENTEQRRVDLQQLITPGTPVKAVAPAVTSIHPNGVVYTLPSDFLYAVEESAITNVSTPEEIKILPVTYNYYRSNLKNPYKKPNEELAWRMDISRVDHGEDGGNEMTGRTAKRVEIITAPATTINTYRLVYLKIPPAIVCDRIAPANQRHSILDETIHNEIVDEAVKIAIAATTPETYQISDKEQKENEF